MTAVGRFRKMYTFQSCKTLLVDLAISANLHYTMMTLSILVTRAISRKWSPADREACSLIGSCSKTWETWKIKNSRDSSLIFCQRRHKMCKFCLYSSSFLSDDGIWLQKTLVQGSTRPSPYGSCYRLQQYTMTLSLGASGYGKVRNGCVMYTVV